VKQLLSPYSEVVRLKRQDLLTYAPAPTPVEFLFIDAMKSWELARKIVCDFFPLLMANRSYVVQQDFAFYHAAVATNHLVMWLLREHFAFVHHVPRSCSVVFRCTKRCEAGHLPLLDPDSFTIEMIEEAYAYSLKCVSPEMRPRLEVAQLGFLIEQGHAAAAQNKMNTIARFPEEWSIPMLAELKRAVQARLVIESAGPDQRQIEWLHEINLWALQSEKEKMSRRGV
jgi:hypothetical protein